MLTGVAILVHGPRYLPYAWVFVVVVVLLIVLIFIRVYVMGDRSRGVAGHHSRRRTGHRASRVPERDGNHGHQAESRRRPNRP